MQEKINEAAGSVLLRCYADQLLAGTGGKLDAFSDAWFIVPFDWAEQRIKKEGWPSIKSFLDNYTFDNTEGWLQQAIADGALLGCGAGTLPKTKAMRAVWNA